MSGVPVARQAEVLNRVLKRLWAMQPALAELRELIASEPAKPAARRGRL